MLIVSCLIRPAALVAWLAEVEVSTFHGWCLRLLRTFAHLKGRKSDFRLASGAQQLSYLKEAVHAWQADQGEGDSQRPAGTPAHRLGGAAATPRGSTLIMPSGLTARRATDAVTATAKRLLRSVKDYKLLKDPRMSQDALLTSEFGQFVLGHYAEALRRGGLVDLADLQAFGIELLAHPDVVNCLTRRYRHVLVDEYQDTNSQQLEIIKLLCGMGSNPTATPNALAAPPAMAPAVAPPAAAPAAAPAVAAPAATDSSWSVVIPTTWHPEQLAKGGNRRETLDGSRMRAPMAALQGAEQQHQLQQQQPQPQPPQPQQPQPPPQQQLQPPPAASAPSTRRQLGVTVVGDDDQSIYSFRGGVVTGHSNLSSGPARASRPGIRPPPPAHWLAAGLLPSQQWPPLTRASPSRTPDLC